MGPWVHDQTHGRCLHVFTTKHALNPGLLPEVILTDSLGMTILFHADTYKPSSNYSGIGVICMAHRQNSNGGDIPLRVMLETGQPSPLRSAKLTNDKVSFES